jgi:hypothetical protein
MLTKLRAVMTHLPSPDQDADLRVTFTLAYDDTGVITRTLILSYEDWRDLGSPEQLTVTIDPGDTLNPTA